ncbi:hypothetical protein [Streptomyces sp. NPDC053755]|uniref:hypothetical protein n=1 Tax=Streptomyces sp. NPDC053755 TaxID=3155815 RepID=UPI00342D8B85
MPLNEGPGRHGQHEEFEERLGEALRHTGDGFAADDRHELATGGLRRGRRRVARRRAALVTGSVLAFALVGVGGVYGGGLLGSGDGTVEGTATVGASKPTAAGAESPAERKPYEARIPVEDIAAVVKANTPAGTWTFQGLEGTGQSVTGVYDDGRGKAGFSLGLYRAGNTGEAGSDQVECPDKTYVPYDHCVSEQLPNGSRLMVFQGYEYPDKRVETKSWRAVLLTKDGILIDASEWNAATQKDSPITREDPPFDAAQLKTLVTAPAWLPLIKQLPPDRKAAPADEADPGTPPPAAELGKGEIQAILDALLPEKLRVVGRGGDVGFGYVVVNDGDGKSLVQINVQPRMGDVAGELFGSGDVTTLPDGRKVKLTQQPGEKGGAGVVWWTADTITPDGFRVVVSAFNTGAQHEAATRAEPALTMEQLKTIALSPKWRQPSAG